MNTVHECLFCPQTFDSAAKKDDHILEHFAHEECMDCHQKLIRIGANLYTIHNEATCVKGQCQPDLCKTEAAPDSEADTNINIEDEVKIESNIDEEQIKQEPTEPIKEEDVFSEADDFKENSEIDIDTESWKLEIQSNSDQIEPDSQKMCENENDKVHEMKCYVCGGDFGGNELLQEHMRKEHNMQILDNKFERAECLICKTKLKKNSVRQHIKMVHDSSCKKLKCSYCKSVFLAEQSLKKHIRTCKRRLKSELDNKDVYDVECEICDEVVDSNSLIKHLINKHTKSDSNVFECLLCEENKRRPLCAAYIRNHMRLQHIPNQEKFKCGNCKFVTFNEMTLMKHSQKCTLHICQECSKSFQTKRDLRRHKSTMHRPPGTYLCACTKIFATEDELKDHKISCKYHRKNKTMDRTYECYRCKKTYSSMNTLQGHLKRIHDAHNKQWHCDLCDKLFTFKAEMKRHWETVHLNIHKYICKVCEKPYQSLQLLRYHSYSHTGEKPFKCTFEGCDKTFATPAYVKHHIKTHSKERPHHCPSCDKKFRGRSGLKNHQMTTHRIFD